MWCLIDNQNSYKGILFDTEKEAVEYGDNYLNSYYIIYVVHVTEYLN